jgi:cytochrome c
MAVVSGCSVGLRCSWILVLLLGACAPPTGDTPSTEVPSAAPPISPVAAFDVGPVRSAAEYAAQPEFAAADLERGELLGLACAACHKFGAGEGTLIGPNLHGVFGRVAGAVPDYAYSPALKASGLVWTPVSLEAWLADPTGFVAGTTMAFTGYRDAADRRDLIAHLLRVTQ